MQFIVLIFSVLLLTACSATYQQSNVTGDPQIKLDPEKKVLVSTPKNGSYGKIKYTESGQMTALAVQSAIAERANYVEVTATCKLINECTSEAASKGFDYLAYPVILHWEDRNTEWSGKPDRIKVKLSFLDVKSGDTIHSSMMSGKSKWATFGGDHPQDLLAEPIGKYVSTLY